MECGRTNVVRARSRVRAHSILSSTYHGWPVYMYDDDKAPGDAKGDQEKVAGKVVWYAIKLPFTSPPKP